MNVLEEFQERTSVLNTAHYSDTTGRLVEILKWLENEPLTKQILDKLKTSCDAAQLVQPQRGRVRPKTDTQEEIAAVGLYLVEACRSSQSQFYSLCMSHNIRPPYNTTSVQEHSDQGLKDYVIPFFQYVNKGLIEASAEFSLTSVAEGRFRAC